MNHLETWMKLIEKNGLGDYSGSVITVYNLYKDDQGFSDELFAIALMRSIHHKHNQDDFFQKLIQEIVNGLQDYTRRRFLIS